MLFRRFTIFALILFFVSPLCRTDAASAQEYSLDDLYRLAIKQADRVMIAEEDVYIAERDKDRALSALFPRLTVLGEYRRYSSFESSLSTGSVVQPETTKFFSVRLDQSLYTSGRELTALRIQRNVITRSRYDLYSIKEDLLQRVAVAYYDVFKARRAVDIAETNVARLTKHRDAARTRVRVGEVTKTALLRAEAELSGAASDLTRARNTHDLARAVLARIVGISGDYSLQHDGKDMPQSQSLQPLVSECAITDVACFKDRAESQRSEIKSLEVQRKIAEDQVRFARGAIWPTLSLEGVYQNRDDRPMPASLVRESTYGGVRMTLPIFEGGLRVAEVASAQARERQARLSLNDAKKSVRIDVENAYLDLKTQGGILKSLEDQVVFARDNYSAIAKQFEFGLSNSIDVMDANTLLVTAERQLADAQFNYQLSILRLERATGALLKTVSSRMPEAAMAAGSSGSRPGFFAWSRVKSLFSFTNPGAADVPNGNGLRRVSEQDLAK